MPLNPKPLPPPQSPAICHPTPLSTLGLPCMNALPRPPTCRFNDTSKCALADSSCHCLESGLSQKAGGVAWGVAKLQATVEVGSPMGAGSEVGGWADEIGARSAMGTVGAEAGPRMGTGERLGEAGAVVLRRCCPTEEPLCCCCCWPHFCCRPTCRRWEDSVTGWL